MYTSIDIVVEAILWPIISRLQEQFSLLMAVTALDKPSYEGGVIQAKSLSWPRELQQHEQVLFATRS